MKKHFLKLIPMAHASVTHASAVHTIAAVPLIIQTLIPMVRAKLGVARRRKKTSDGVHKAYAERRFLRATKLGTIAHASVVATPLILLLLTGCVESTSDAFRWSPQSAALRSLQTRRFEASNDKTILSAAVGVMQDLGYNLDSSESQLGLLVASKAASAVDAGQHITKFAMAVLFDVDTGPTDRDQKIRLSITLRRAYHSGRGYVVRAMFQRVVWNTAGRVSRQELITSPQIYQQFFSKLSKSLFLEAHKI